MVLCVQGLNGMEALLDPLSDGGGRGTCVDGGGCSSGSSCSSLEEAPSLSLLGTGVPQFSC